MTDFTPSPWLALKSVIHGADGNLVALPLAADKQRAANDLHLMAASPQLLSALHNAAEFLNFYFLCADAEKHREWEGEKNIHAEAKIAHSVALSAIELATALHKRTAGGME